MKKILVVDDDKDIVEIVQFILQSKGFDVLTHSNGIGVPEVVMKYDPNLVLLDVDLPGKSGKEICKELKDTTNCPPIVLFSAHQKIDEAFVYCNADGLIPKPFDVKELIEKINFHIA